MTPPRIKMNRSGIEWVNCFDGFVGYTWNPQTGCAIEPISPGCDFCWARRMAHRQRARNGYDFDMPFRPTWHEERLTAPSLLKRPAAIAVCLMADLFHPQVKNQNLPPMFRMMRKCHWHRFFLLTKRPGGLEEFLRRNHDKPEIQAWPYSNVAVGVSVESADYLHRVDTLLRIQAAMRFVSFEPLLGDVGDISAYLPGDCLKCGGPDWATGSPLGRYCCRCDANAHLRRIDWAVVGGESGPKGRLTHPDWVRSIRDQCAEAGIPAMMKQWGKWTPLLAFEEDYPKKIEEGFRGRRLAQWMARDGRLWMLGAPTEEERVEGGFELMAPVGKKHSGCRLDGEMRMGFPASFGSGEGLAQ